MAQVWKVMLFANRRAAVVPTIWLKTIDGVLCCYWPPVDEKKAEKLAIKYTPPAQGWKIHRNVTVLKCYGETNYKL